MAKTRQGPRHPRLLAHALQLSGMNTRPATRKRKSVQLLIVLAALAAVAIAARAAAPSVVKHYVNLAFADMGEYTGSVTDVDLFLLRGGYQLRNVRVVKLSSSQD